MKNTSDFSEKFHGKGIKRFYASQKENCGNAAYKKCREYPGKTQVREGPRRTPPVPRQEGEMWVYLCPVPLAENQNGKYHTQGRTSTLLAFSDIFVDNSMEDGMQSDVNDFALALYQYLKGLNLSVSRTITGNSIDVIIY